jgi:23S rRNA pseudouridine2605 synthase
LRKGIVVDGERFQPMSVVLDRIQGANAWLTIGLREGKNREIRRALNALDLYVNRLIRVSYGPFRLGDLTEGQVEEVKPRVLRDQLGLDPMAEEEVPQKPAPKGAPRGPGGVPRTVSHGPVRGKPRAEGDAPKPRGDKPFEGGKPFAAKPYAAKTGPKGAPRGDGPKPGGPKGDGPRPARPRRPS